jgi:hypothetical protein
MARRRIDIFRASWKKRPRRIVVPRESLDFRRGTPDNREPSAMNTPARTPLATIVLLALAAVPLAHADTAPPNAGMGFVSVGGQADSQHNQQALATLSLPVGQHAWAQAGAGKSRDSQQAGGRKPGIVTGAVGVAGSSAQLTLNAAHRGDGGRYRQTDLGSSLDWKDGGNVVGVDLTHRNSRATGTVASGSGTSPAQVRVAGTGLGLHGTLQASERVSVYGAVARNHYKSSTTTTQSTPTTPGGLLGLAPVLGGTSIVNRDEAALNRSALVGATYRFDKVAVSGELATGHVLDDGGSLRSVELKAAIDVAPGWRVAPGIGRGSSPQAGHATFASLSATYGW